MRYAILCLLALSISIPGYTKNIYVVDSEDKAPIPGSTIISDKGLIIGCTDAEGKISVGDTDFPLSVRNLGYETAFISDASTDTIFLPAAKYSLHEVVINPAERPITRVLAFVREYCTGSTSTDTLQLYSEYMIEYFNADGKVKGFDKSHRSGTIRNAKRYGRLANSQGLDSVMRPKSDDDVSALSFAELMSRIPFENLSEPESIKKGIQSSDTVFGKYYPKLVGRKTRNHFILDCDVLADYSDHKWSPWIFKMLGMTMDMEKASWSRIYNGTESGIYGLPDFIYGTCNLTMLGKGRLLKKLLRLKDEITIDCYIEIYPVEINSLTREEYLEIKKEFKERRSEMIFPEHLLPLTPAIETLKERVNQEYPE